MPIPFDPFALPTAPDSDPLRGPIFVALNVACLKTDNKAIFHGKYAPTVVINYESHLQPLDNQIFVIVTIFIFVC